MNAKVLIGTIIAVLLTVTGIIATVVHNKKRNSLTY